MNDYLYHAIETWDYRDPAGWINFAVQNWNTAFGKVKYAGDKIVFITGGWSINEEIISAMQENVILYSRLWVASMRGGKHVFEWRINEQKTGR